MASFGLIPSLRYLSRFAISRFVAVGVSFARISLRCCSNSRHKSASIHPGISPIELLSSLLFSGNSSVTPASLRWRFTLSCVKALFLADFELWRPNSGIDTPVFFTVNQPTFFMASVKPETPTSRFINFSVTLGALPSVVCWSNQRQTRINLPTTASGSRSSDSAISQTSGLSGRATSIFIQSPAISKPPQTIQLP